MLCKYVFWSKIELFLDPALVYNMFLSSHRGDQEVAFGGCLKLDRVNFVDVLFCNVGYERLGYGACTACPAGKYRDRADASLCQDCPVIAPVSPVGSIAEPVRTISGCFDSSSMDIVEGVTLPAIESVSFTLGDPIRSGMGKDLVLPFCCLELEGLGEFRQIPPVHLDTMYSSSGLLINFLDPLPPVLVPLVPLPA